MNFILCLLILLLNAFKLYVSWFIHFLYKIKLLISIIQQLYFIQFKYKMHGNKIIQSFGTIHIHINLYYH